MEARSTVARRPVTSAADRTETAAMAGGPAPSDLVEGRPGWRARRAADGAILAAGRTLVARSLVVGTVGNVSARLGETLRITPTRLAYETMRRRDLVTVHVVSGRTVDRRSGQPSDGATPSRELPLHLAVYRARPDVAAVIHTHSVAATAWSFLDEPLEPELEDLAYHGIGPIRTAAPAPPGSDALAANVAHALGPSNAVLLGEHGVLAVGPTVADALTVAEVVEHQARVAWTLRTVPEVATPHPAPRVATSDTPRMPEVATPHPARRVAT